MVTKQLIFRTVHGSHLYGLAHEDSDRDVYEVYEGSDTGLRHSISGEVDTVRGSLHAFISRAETGSHQSCEALFSRKKEWAPGMFEKWGPYIESFRVVGGDVFEKYERTIRKFCYLDFKRRRHAVRLYLNLKELRKTGQFDPTLGTLAASLATLIAKQRAGDDLARDLEVTKCLP